MFRAPPKLNFSLRVFAYVGMIPAQFAYRIRKYSNQRYRCNAVRTASIVFGGVGRVVLFSYYKSILLCILLCVILTVSPCSFFYLLIAFAQIHSPSSTPSCSNNIVGGANTPINILLPAQDIHRPICGRVVLFYLCSGTAPTCAAH